MQVEIMNWPEHLYSYFCDFHHLFMIIKTYVGNKMPKNCNIRITFHTILNHWMKVKDYVQSYEIVKHITVSHESILVLWGNFSQIFDV